MKFEISEMNRKNQLGDGSFAQVFKMKDYNTNTYYAVKCFKS